MHLIDDVVLSKTHCTFVLAEGPNVELFPKSVPLTRAEIREKLRVTSQAHTQCIEHILVYVHPHVFNAITDWLVDE